MYKTFTQTILFFFLVFICLAFLYLVFVDSSFNDSDPKTVPVLGSLDKIFPTRIKIPSIGVNALIKPVGLTKQKSMESPKEPNETAWFQLGPSPGEEGSSVIAGHRGWKRRTAIFDDLHKLELGDKVYVEDEKGDMRTFIVREMRVYDATDIVPEVWYKKEGAYLNLITCSGKWNVITGSSQERLVVFTDLVI